MKMSIVSTQGGGMTKKIKWFRIEAENRESIHNHSAYAFLEKTNEGK